MKNYKTVIMIPARGGSNGIPRKNLMLYKGKPLILHTIEYALKQTRINRVIVSTDDDEIAEISKQNGAEVPFKRPSRLAQDLVPTYPVVRHMAEFLQKTDYKTDIIIVLNPTSPKRPPDLVKKCISLYSSNNNSDSVHSVLSYDQNPGRILIKKAEQAEFLAEEMFVCRQALPTLYYLSGHLHSVKTHSLFKHDTMFGKILPLLVKSYYYSDIN